MKNIILKISILSIAVCFLTLFFGVFVLAGQAPTANAGADLYASPGQSVSLQGSGSDPDGNNITYFWSCNGGSLSSAGVSQPSYTVPSFGTQNSYTCTLTVTDSEGLSNSDIVIIYTNQSIGGNNVQTNPATNVFSNQATLNGYFSTPILYNTGSVWFQWGATTSYGNETNHQNQNNSGSFSQNISGLSANTTYHFRAVAQSSGGIIYGQDAIFYTSNSGAGIFSIAKKVINISSGNLNWQQSINANPSDVLSFAITLQAPANQDIHNVIVKDLLPYNLIYKGNLTVNANINYTGNPALGINIGTIPAGGIAIVAYQAQVLPETSFSYGATTLANTAIITSSETGSQTVSASVVVNKSSISGATTISTGLTNNPITDSFFLPLMLIVLGSWLYFSGNIYKFSDWLGKFI